MEITAWLSLATICLLGAMTPGPSLAIVLKHTITNGRAHGVATGIAHGFGVALYAIFTVLGMAILIKETPWLFNLIKYAGALFLLWLAFKAFTAKSSLGKIEQDRKKSSIRQSAIEGFLVAFLNPKLAIFFLALFSQFITPSDTLDHKIIMVLTVGGIDAFWYTLIALILSQAKFIDKLRNNIGLVEKATGVALIGVTVRILL